LKRENKIAVVVAFRRMMNSALCKILGPNLWYCLVVIKKQVQKLLELG